VQRVIKKENKVSVNWAAHRLHLSDEKQKWVFLIAVLQSKLAALMHFLHNKHNLQLASFTFCNPWLENEIAWVWLLKYAAQTQREFCSGLCRRHDFSSAF